MLRGLRVAFSFGWGMGGSSVCFAIWISLFSDSLLSRDSFIFRWSLCVLSLRVLSLSSVSSVGSLFRGCFLFYIKLFLEIRSSNKICWFSIVSFSRLLASVVYLSKCLASVHLCIVRFGVEVPEIPLGYRLFLVSTTGDICWILFCFKPLLIELYT